MRHDVQGKCLWARRYAGYSDDRALGVAIDRDGSVVATGFFGGSVDLGGGPLMSAGESDIFVVKLGPGGEHLWSRRFGGTGYDSAQRVALDAQGNVLLTGDFAGRMAVGPGEAVSVGDRDLFVAKLSPEGQPLWVRALGGPRADVGLAVSTDPQGSVFVAGSFYAPLDAGAGPIGHAGYTDGLLVKLGADGAVRWARALGGPDGDAAAAIQVAADGDVVVGGRCGEGADLGGGPLPVAGMLDVCVGRYSPDGTHRWSRSFGSAGVDSALGLAVDAGGLVMVGYFGSSVEGGTIDFGVGPLRSAGGTDLFVARLDGAGRLEWAERFGAGGFDAASGVAAHRDGLTVAGAMEGVWDLAGEPVRSAGNADILLLRLSSHSPVTD